MHPEVRQVECQYNNWLNFIQNAFKVLHRKAEQNRAKHGL